MSSARLFSQALSYISQREMYKVEVRAYLGRLEKESRALEER
jgi:SOS response regulatory protein OraA/RecX